MEPVEDGFEVDPVDEEFYAPMDEAVGDAGLLVDVLADMRERGRLWAIAHTKAEELFAWLQYALAKTVEERERAEIEGA